MSEKKRKNGPDQSERPNKKQQTAPSSVKVRHLTGPDTAKPVLASSPGVSLPTNIKFQSYSKKDQSGPPVILLHSAEHPTIDYTASEGDSALDNHLKHYVAVFDVATGSLEVTEAKRVTVRSSVRITRPARNDDEAEAGPVTSYMSKKALTEAFGTKKSKKAVQSATENRLLAQATGDADDPIAAAILADIQDQDPDNVLASDAASRSNKPLPPANLNTDEITEVYSHSVLVHPSPYKSTLASMPTSAWISSISAKQEVLTRSRFVANRVGYLVKNLLATPEASDPACILSVQTLRYIQLLLEVHNYVRTLPRKRRIARVEDWPETALSEGTPTTLINPIISHFFPGDRTPTSHAVTLLRSTILALTLHVPPPNADAVKKVLITECTDVSLDMAIDLSETRKLYRELGCKVEPAKDAELNLWGLEKLGKKRKKEDGKMVGKKPDFARLKLPLEFPKMSRGKAQGRR